MKRIPAAGLLAVLTILSVLPVFLPAGLLRAEETCLVTRVIDGDTIEVDSGERVRYIGIDAPEAGLYGNASSEANKRLVQGKRVRLEFDLERRDRYGRLLAYVWVGETFINGRLIEDGYAQVMTIPPNLKYEKVLIRLQEQARERRVGLWVLDDSPTVYVTRSGKKYHRAGCAWLSKSKIPISLKEAKSRGYTPCLICKPP